MLRTIPLGNGKYPQKQPSLRATSGIGKATAQLFAAHHLRLVLCGRRQEQRTNWPKTSQRTEVHTLNFDVRDRNKVFESIQSLPEAFSHRPPHQQCRQRPRPRPRQDGSLDGGMP